MDPRKGLFQNCFGMFNLEVISEDIVSVEKKYLHPLQKRYHMESGYDEDYVIVPTLSSIQTGNVPLPFRINHNSDNPTHELVWIQHADDYPCSHYEFIAKRDIDRGTEVTFNYKFKKTLSKRKPKTSSLLTIISFGKTYYL